jgi:hypothetical protein
MLKCFSYLFDAAQTALGNLDFHFSVLVRIELLSVVLQDLQNLELLIRMKLADLLLQLVGFLESEHRRLIDSRFLRGKIVLRDGL